MPAPAFLVTVDTEGDNIWSGPRTISTRNARFLPRFQALCEKYRLKPTYLTNWEMANCPEFVEFGKDVLARNAAEIGTHIHAWNSPPLVPLTNDDDRFQPYLIEYPPDQIREKVKVMTQKLEDTFGVKMLSHRSGRWSFDQTYAQILIEQGYRVDCSVTPHVSWRFCKGDPRREGGTDYSSFLESEYFIDPGDIRKQGDSALMEIPVTVVRTRQHGPLVELIRRNLSSSFYGTIVFKRLFPNYLILIPTGANLEALMRILQFAREEKRPYIELAIHSSELMPGGSPKVPTEQRLQHLHEDLEIFFAAASEIFQGMTLNEYYERVVGGTRANP